MERNTQRNSQTRVFRKPAFATHGNRPRFSGGGRGGGYASRQGGRGRGASKYIDPNRFINKAVITEKVEHFVPEHNFIDFAVDERLKTNIVSKGYITPTPIQDKTIPHILKGQDVVGIANTGTGKTAAFLIPLINKVLTQEKENVLIVVPTRELALQIQEELNGFITSMKLYSVVCVGGSPICSQIRALRYRNEFVIGTPGRIKDLIERKVLSLSHFKTVVLDEADRMLDMGFFKDVTEIIEHCPKKRQSFLFSATIIPIWLSAGAQGENPFILSLSLW